jgi:4-amino-4-deoxy-L-arabinose transferase-like glycosyltransferase
MIDKLKNEWLIHLVCLILALFYLWGITLVPFHPDESTQIYMSQDAYDYIEDPLILAYSPDTDLAGKTIYRAIDMPLTRYLIGFARFLTNSPGLSSDWNWALSWDDNLEAGAYPSPSLLNTARFIPTLLIPLSLYLFYFSIRKFIPKSPALIAVLFLGLNPLILLHCRRAMAESALLFGTAFFLWSITRDQIKPILVGIALAVAFNAKQTGIFLLPVGIIAVCSLSTGELRLRNMLARSAALLSVFLVITLLLNPFYWQAPLSAFVASYQARAHLLELQLSDHLQDGFNFPKSLLHLTTNLFITPAAISDVDNYLIPLASQVEKYKNMLPHTWGRNLFYGSLQITFLIGGLIVSYKRYQEQPKNIRTGLILLLITTLFFFFGILFFLPIPWQRYILPLLPLAAFWIGCGLMPLTDAINLALDARRSSSGLSK